MAQQQATEQTTKVNLGFRLPKFSSKAKKNNKTSLAPAAGVNVPPPVRERQPDVSPPSYEESLDNQEEKCLDTKPCEMREEEASASGLDENIQPAEVEGEEIAVPSKSLQAGDGDCDECGYVAVAPTHHHGFGFRFPKFPALKLRAPLLQAPTIGFKMPKMRAPGFGFKMPKFAVRHQSKSRDLMNCRTCRERKERLLAEEAQAKLGVSSHDKGNIH